MNSEDLPPPISVSEDMTSIADLNRRRNNQPVPVVRCTPSDSILATIDTLLSDKWRYFDIEIQSDGYIQIADILSKAPTFREMKMSIEQFKEIVAANGNYTVKGNCIAKR